MSEYVYYEEASDIPDDFWKLATTTKLLERRELMSHPGHAIHKCKHGAIVMQCRCMESNKTVRIVQCPDSCAEPDVGHASPLAEAATNPTITERPEVARMRDQLNTLLTELASTAIVQGTVLDIDIAVDEVMAIFRGEVSS